MLTFKLLPARHRRLARLVALAVLSGGYLLPMAIALHRQRMSAGLTSRCSSSRMWCKAGPGLAGSRRPASRCSSMGLAV